MELQGFSPEEIETIYNCLQAVYEVKDVLGSDFETVLGFSRDELFSVIENWDRLSFTEGETGRIILGVLHSISGYPHDNDWEIFCYTGKMVSEIEKLTDRLTGKADRKAKLRTQELVCSLRTIPQYSVPDKLTQHYSFIVERKLGTLLCFFNLSAEEHLHTLSLCLYGFKVIRRTTELSVPYHEITSVKLGKSDIGKYYLLIGAGSEEITIGKDDCILSNISIFRLKTFFEKVEKSKDRRRFLRNIIKSS